MSFINEEYLKKHPKSAELHRQSDGAFPDGVTHDTRYVMPFPVFMSEASGPLKWDVDGNEYVDYVSGHGALILGHSIHVQLFLYKRLRQIFSPMIGNCITSLSSSN